jgi:hypothetical protein
MDILETLFGGAAKVKLIKLFLLNPDSIYDVSDAAIRSKVSNSQARKEINNLEKIGFIKSKSYTKESHVQKNRAIKIIKKRVYGWTLDTKFPYIDAMESFLSNVNPFKHSDIVEKNKQGRQNTTACYCWCFYKRSGK